MRGRAQERGGEGMRGRLSVRLGLSVEGRVSLAQILQSTVPDTVQAAALLQSMARVRRPWTNRKTRVAQTQATEINMFGFLKKLGRRSAKTIADTSSSSSHDT